MCLYLAFRIRASSWETRCTKHEVKHGETKATKEVVVFYAKVCHSFDSSMGNAMYCFYYYACVGHVLMPQQQ